MITRWWSKREKREKTLLSIMLGFLFVVVCFELFSGTPTTPTSFKKSSWEQKKQELLLASKLEDRILLLKQKGAVTTHPASEGFIRQSLKKNHMQHFLRAIAFSNKQVTLQFDSVPFDQLTDWLTDLTRRSSAHIVHWSATRLATRGVVSTKLELAY